MPKAAPLRLDSKLLIRVSLTDERLRSASSLLAYLALVTDLLLRTMEGSEIALALSSISLFLFVYQWSPSKHLLKSKVDSEDLFFAAASLILFSFLNVATKILVPIAMAVSFDVALGIMVILAGTCLCSWLLFLWVHRRTRHRDFVEDPGNFSNEKLREQYVRVGNSVIIASMFLALDAPDLILILAAIVISSKSVVKVVSRGLSRLSESGVAVSQSRTARRALRRFSRLVGRLDLEEALWERVLYVTQYKRGFSFLMLALVSGLPAMVYSYSIDFLAPEVSKFVVFVLLALPSLVAVYALRFPRGLLSTAKEAGNFRLILLAASLAAPLEAAVAVFVRPSLIGYNGSARFSDPSFVGLYFGFVWLAIIPIVVALPVYSMIVAAEFEDYASFIRRARLLAISPCIATSLMVACAIFVSNVVFPASVVMFTLYVSMACYFYPFIVLFCTRELRDVERRTRKPMQQWVDRVRGPRWYTDLVAVALGSFFFPLLVLVGVSYPWVIFRYGLLFPHVLPILLWIAGGVSVTCSALPLSQPKRLLDHVRIGLVGSLGVICQAVLFIELPYSLTFWAPWVVFIPVGFAIGAMVTMAVRWIAFD
jgi:hypothetical protein